MLVPQAGGRQRASDTHQAPCHRWLSPLPYAFGSVSGAGSAIDVEAAVGAVVGGLAGKGVAEKIDPTREDAYWRENYKTRPYIGQDDRYEDYGPAYGYGVSAFTRYPDQDFDDVESDLSREWASARGTSTLGWDRARDATRDAWTRVAQI